MRTDTTHIHLLLQSIREDQLHQGSLLEDIAGRQAEGLRLLRGIFKELRNGSIQPKWILPKGALIVGIQYLAVLTAMIYMLRGGDLGKLAGLVKLFGL